MKSNSKKDPNSKEIRAVFEDVAPGYKVTKELAIALHKYERWFVNKNQRHADFFNGNLIGVNKIIYSTYDEAKLIDEVIKIDDIELSDRMNKISWFKEGNMKTASKPINLILVWLIYKFNTSNLPQKIKQSAMIDCNLLLQYIMFSSALFNYFGKYEPKTETMEAVNEEMSLKFNIKKHKTWGRYFRFMAETMFNKDYIHKAGISEGATDKQIVYVISDNKTRINGLIQNHYNILIKIKDSDTHIRKSKLFIDTPDGVEINSLKRELPGFRDYIHSIVGYENSFIKDDLLKATYAIMSRKQPDGTWKPQCKEKLVLNTLQSISEFHDIDKKVYDLVDRIMVHSFEYLYSNGFGSYSIVPIEEIVVKLKGLYQSSLGNNENLLKNRKELEQFITKHSKGNSVAAVKSTRTAVMLYIIIRAFVRRNFT